MLISYIVWSVSPEFFHLGPISVRWYGFLFAMGFVIGYFILGKIFSKEKKSKNDLEQLAVYVIFGTVIGARLGHCLFYNPEFYLSNPVEILKVWTGGLASHGAAIGIIISIYLFSKKKKDMNMLWVLDRVVIVVALAGCLIRLGNLFNSEIIGKATEVPWAFIFTSVDSLPRHPAQLYESIAYLIIFGILLTVYQKGFPNLKSGLIFGLFLLLVFAFRFIVEFVKEVQEEFEAGMSLNMGQLLSIPFILLGGYFILRALKQSSSFKTSR